MANSILIIDDDEMLANNVRLYLERYEWHVEVAYSAGPGLKLLESMHPDIVLTDHMLPGKTGLQLIGSALEIDPQIKIVMMTGEGSVQVAVDAMKAGASDYLTKPVSLAELKMVLEKALGQSQLENTLSVLQRKQSHGVSMASLIGETSPMLALKAKARQVLEAEKRISDGDLPSILITGQTGTGKEVMARALHFDGVRRERPFVELNCASLPSNLLEAELFGHERGAFTDAKDRKIGLAEAANGGTLFLDEIGEVDLAIQAKLLKLLEDKTLRRIGSVRERKVDIRIISATNRDLEKMVREGSFRSDLYFRLRVITLAMPPLCGAGEDILRLANFYLQTHARRYGKKNLRFSPEAELLLQTYAWPGNVREMKNMLEQTVLLADDELITSDQLAICPGLLHDHREPDDVSCQRESSVSAVRGTTRVSDVERDLVLKMLEKTDWNVSKSAKLLGLSRDMLRYRIEKYRFVVPQE